MINMERISAESLLGKGYAKKLDDLKNEIDAEGNKKQAELNKLDTAIKALQLAFAVYQASNERRPVAPDAIDGAVSPVGWPPNGEDLRRDVEEMMAREQARAERLGS